jgi:hydrogenase maturation factor
MSVCDGLEFETEIASDTAPLHNLVNALIAGGIDVHVLRDPTRGGGEQRAHGDRADCECRHGSQ